jgi:K+-sensing histidine kinase KdpD
VAVLISWLNDQLKVARRRAEVARAVAESTAAGLRTLERLTAVSLRAPNVDSLLSGLLEIVRDALAVDAARILLLNEEERSLRVRAWSRPDGHHEAAASIPLGQGLVGRTALDTDVMVADIVPEKSDFWSNGMHSCAAAPLVIEQRTIGVLDIGVTAARRFNASELRLLELVADRIAAGIERARLLEAERRAYGAAQRAITVRDEFLAHASHELRTPLSHIKGFVSTLRQTYIEWDDEARADFLGEIEREADRLAKMITDLLDVSRLESGGLDPGNRTRATPREIVNGGIDRVPGLLLDRGVTLDVPANLPNVLVDVAQVERVIANLLENAAKYAPCATPICVTAARKDSAIEIGIEDAGAGIPEEDCERIFEKSAWVR